ncbi:MAG: polysaccharide pyruvyl transferase family protein [Eubacteriales bacterium]
MPRKIVFVSRLDGDCALGARTLCRIAPRLNEKYPDIEIIIVGGGDAHSEIFAAAREISTKINRELIKAVGKATNPAIFYENHDENTLFVGVSRAALEAMAHGVPAILLGDEGYLGLFDESKLAVARATNFTARSAGFGARSAGVFSTRAQSGKIQTAKAAKTLKSAKSAPKASAPRCGAGVSGKETEKLKSEKYFLFATCGGAHKRGHVSSADAARVLEYVGEQFNARPIIAVLNPEDDFEISQKIAKITPNSAIFCPKTASEMKNLAKNSEFCICERYHGALFSLACGAPTLAVSSDPKMRALVREFVGIDAVPLKKFFKTAINSCDFAIKCVQIALAACRENAAATARLVEENTRRADAQIDAVLRKFTQ